MDEWRAIVKRAWDDDDFKERLKKDTAAVLREYGIKVPSGVTFEIVEDQLKGKRHLVLPPRPQADDPSLSIDDFGRDAEDGDPGF